MKNLLFIILSFLVVEHAVLSLEPKSEAPRPNILLILADDVGQEVLGCYGGTSYPTPQLDALAESGIRFNHGYSMAVCHPTRVSILSGRYPFRMEKAKWGSYPKKEESRTIAQQLKKAGYRTAVAGKWQLTLLKEDPKHPHRLGFDESCLFGWHEGPRFHNPLIWQNGKIRKGLEKAYGPDVYTDFLIDFMKADRKKPFFAFYSMALCHDVTDDLKKPVEYPPGLDRYLNYKEMAHDMDRMVGKLQKALKESGLRDNTLVLFVGDNGTAQRSIIRAKNGKYIRDPVFSMKGDKKIPGGKGKLTDGGTRVPWLVSWPAKIKPKQVVEDLVDVSDLYSTFCVLAGADPQGMGKIDGVSFASRLLKGVPGPKRFAYAEHKNKSWVRTQRFKFYKSGKFFDMNVDPDEKNALKGKLSKQAMGAKLLLLEAFKGLGIEL